MGLQQKPAIRAEQFRTQEAALSTQEIRAKWWPEISVAYNYRYTPIIPTTLIPVGQFNLDNPTDVVRGIRMGSKWQQNGGLLLSQPLIDFSISRSLKRSRLQKQLAQTNYRNARQVLIREITLSYLNICRWEELLREAAADTVGSALLLKEQQLRFGREQLLRSELNRAKINHNDAVTWLKEQQTELIMEKIYLAYLTGQSPDSVVFHKSFDSKRAESDLKTLMNSDIPTDSIPAVQQLFLQSRIAGAELREAQSRNLPTFSFDGYVGGNHYAPAFDPFRKRSWYGNAYIGISMNLPILYGEDISARNKRLKIKMHAFELDATDEKERLHTLSQQRLVRIGFLEETVNTLTENRELQRESLRVLRRRFEEQQITSFELNIEETELLKLQSKLGQNLQDLNTERLQYLYEKGLLEQLAPAF